MKFLGYFLALCLTVVPCFAAEQKNDHMERSALSLRIARNLRTAEQEVFKELQGHPKLLDSEEILLHRASMLATKAGKLRAMQKHSGRKLHRIEAMLQKQKKHIMKKLVKKHRKHRESSGAKQLDSIARKETRLLRGGRAILREAHDVKKDLAQMFGHSDPRVSATLAQLMDKVEGAQKHIMVSEKKAAVHASKLAKSMRKKPAAKLAAFAQKFAKKHTAAKDPVQRMHLEKEAMSQLKSVKTEIAEALGSDDKTARKVEAMIDKVEGSMQRLEKSAEQGMEKASLMQSATHAKTSARATARRLQRESRRMRGLVKRTRKLAKEDKFISKETKFAQRIVQKELGKTEVGQEVSELLSMAASEARKAAANDRHLAAAEGREARAMAAAGRAAAGHSHEGPASREQVSQAQSIEDLAALLVH